MTINVSFRWHGPTTTLTGEEATAIQIRCGKNQQKYMLCSVAALQSRTPINPLPVSFADLSNAEVTLSFKNKSVTQNSPTPPNCQPTLSPLPTSTHGKKHFTMVVSLEHAKLKPNSPISYPKA